MRRLMLLLSRVSLCLCVGQSLAAQTLDVRRGARVRVTATARPSKPIIGVVDSVSGGTITLQTGGYLPTRLAISQIDRVEVSRTQKRPMWSKTAPLWLTFSAAGAGALLGYATEPEGGLFDRDFAAAAAAGAAGALGLLVGTGLAIGVTEDTWESVLDARGSQRSSGAPAVYVAPRGRGLGVGLRAAF